MKIRKNIQYIYQKNVVKKKNIFIINSIAQKIKISIKDFVRFTEETLHGKLIFLCRVEKQGQRHYLIIKDFNTFMYDHTLHQGKKHFCPYCLQAFSIEEILKGHIKDKVISKSIANKEL